MDTYVQENKLKSNFLRYATGLNFTMVLSFESTTLTFSRSDLKSSICWLLGFRLGYSSCRAELNTVAHTKIPLLVFELHGAGVRFSSHVTFLNHRTILAFDFGGVLTDH